MGRSSGRNLRIDMQLEGCLVCFLSLVRAIKIQMLTKLSKIHSLQGDLWLNLEGTNIFISFIHHFTTWHLMSHYFLRKYAMVYTLHSILTFTNQ